VIIINGIDTHFFSSCSTELLINADLEILFDINIIIYFYKQKYGVNKLILCNKFLCITASFSKSFYKNNVTSYKLIDKLILTDGTLL